MTLITLYIVSLFVPSIVLCTHLIMNPTQITVEGELQTTHLNSSCFPPGNVTACYAITIGHKSFSGTETEMVVIAEAINNNEPTIKDEGLRPRLLVSGDIRGTTPYLQFSLRDPTTDDAGVFYCKTLFVPASAGRSEDTVNVTAIASSGSSVSLISSLPCSLTIALLVQGCAWKQE